MSRFRSSPSGKEAGELLRGLNLSVDASGRLTPVSRPSRFFDWDYFLSGPSASGATVGTIGRLGWSLLGSGTPAFTRQNATLSSVAKANLATSNVNGNISSLTLGDTAGKAVSNPVECPIVQCAWRMNNSLATKRFYFGWSNNFGINPNISNVTAFGIIYDSSVSPNYLIINKFGSANNQTFNTGIAVPQNSAQLLSFVRSETNFLQYDLILGTESSGVVSEQVIATDLDLAVGASLGYNANLGFAVTTLAAASSTIELGYFGMVGSQPFPTIFTTTTDVLDQEE